MSRPLTAELVRARTKTDNLVHVKKFTLCGNDLDDIRILRQMPNLEVLSLSVNRIESLREFANCRKLEELYVRGNKIADLSEIRYLRSLPNLKVLWLSENPCAEHQYYREYLINSLPQLYNIDNRSVTQAERVEAAKLASGEPDQPEEQEEEYSREQENYGQRYENEDNQRYDYRSEQRNDADNYQENESIPAGYGQGYGHQQYQRDERREDANVRRSPTRGERRSPGNYARNLNETTAKNENILIAMLTLMKDLDMSELKILKRDIEKRLNEV